MPLSAGLAIVKLPLVVHRGADVVISFTLPDGIATSVSAKIWDIDNNILATGVVTSELVSIGDERDYRITFPAAQTGAIGSTITSGSWAAQIVDAEDSSEPVIMYGPVLIEVLN